MTVLLISAPGQLSDLVEAAAAAQSIEVIRTTHLENIANSWESAAVVFISEELVAGVVARPLPPHPRIYLIGEDADAMAPWSMPLNAPVVLLPNQSAWLSAILEENNGQGGAAIAAVVGGAGGTGSSTFAIGLALAAASSYGSVALLDIDPLGGGIDLPLGIERDNGWRWPNLHTAQGHVGDLRNYLPQIAGVSVVTMARDHPIEITSEPLTAIVGTLRRHHQLVVIDVGRSLSSTAQEAMRMADWQLLLVSPTVRQIAAAAQIRKALRVENPQIILREGKLGSDAIAELLGGKIIAKLPNDNALSAAADRGDLAHMSARRPYRQVCAKVARHILGAAK